jgi:tetratricopeptide (TPR) repeat protein
MIKNWLISRKSKGLYIKGTFESMRGDYKKAIEILSLAIQANPTFLDAYQHRGVAYMESGNNEAAIKDQSFVISQEPDRILAYYNRGVAYFIKGEMDHAMLDMKEAIRFDPKFSDAYTYIGHIYIFRKEFDSAIINFNKAIELGDLKQGYFNRASAYEEKKDFTSSIADWTKVIELIPNSAIAYCRRGILYSKTNNRELAVKDLVRGLKDKTQLPDSLRQESENLLAKLQAAG